MEVKLLEQNQNLYTFQFIIPESDFQTKLNEFYSNIKKDYVKPGFRKGRVPVHAIKLDKQVDHKGIEKEIYNYFKIEHFFKSYEMNKLNKDRIISQEYDVMQQNLNDKYCEIKVFVFPDVEFKNMDTQYPIEYIYKTKEELQIFIYDHIMKLFKELIPDIQENDEYIKKIFQINKMQNINNLKDFENYIKDICITDNYVNFYNDYYFKEQLFSKIITEQNVILDSNKETLGLFQLQDQDNFLNNTKLDMFIKKYNHLCDNKTLPLPQSDIINNLELLYYVNTIDYIFNIFLIKFEDFKNQTQNSLFSIYKKSEKTQQDIDKYIYSMSYVILKNQILENLKNTIKQ